MSKMLPSTEVSKTVNEQLPIEIVESLSVLTTSSRGEIANVTNAQEVSEVRSPAEIRLEKIVRLQLNNGTLPSTIKSALEEFSLMYAEFGYNERMFDIVEKFTEKKNLLTTVITGLKRLLDLRPDTAYVEDLLELLYRQADEAGALCTTVAAGMDKLIPILNRAVDPAAIIKQALEKTSKHLLLTTIVNQLEENNEEQASLESVGSDTKRLSTS